MSCSTKSLTAPVPPFLLIILIPGINLTSFTAFFGQALCDKALNNS